MHINKNTNEKKIIENLVLNSNGLLKLTNRSKGSYRLQPVDRDQQINEEHIVKLIKNSNYNIEKIVLPGWPESSSGRFKTYYINDSDVSTSFVVGRGENKGQKLERKIAESIDLDNDQLPEVLIKTIDKMGINKEELLEIKWSGKACTKRSISLNNKNIGQEIADFKIITKNNNQEFVSLKGKNGDTFGNHGYSDAFKKIKLLGKEVFVPCTSVYDDFIVNALGVNKFLISNGITDVLKQRETENIEDVVNVKLNFNKELLEQYLACSLGHGYWYVREKSKNEFNIISLKDKEDSRKIVGEIVSVVARYPRYSKTKKSSKQFQAIIKTTKEKFVLEIRHSHRGLKPNELKLKSFGKYKE